MTKQKRHSAGGKSKKHAGDDNAGAEQPEQRESKAGGYLGALLVLGLGVFIGYLHWYHVSLMHENNIHFSHLSTMEREYSLRSEMGLYYNYYKIIYEAPSFWSGVSAIMNDNKTEYPDTINVLQRFNLYPEVWLAFCYRTYLQLANYMKWDIMSCYQVSRGEGYSPVQSCEGSGEPVYFYTNMVWILHGVNMACIFWFGTFLASNLFGGALAVSCFFFNHGEATRVMWTPTLRESHAYPFLMMQLFLVTYMLRLPNCRWTLALPLAALTLLFMLPWQFASFALLTQTLSICGTYILGFIGWRKFAIILLGQTIAFVLNYLLMFGNQMLLTSFYAACLIVCWCLILFEPVFSRIHRVFLSWLSQGLFVMFSTVIVKQLMSFLLQVQDDSHIGDLLRCKFTYFKTFDTQLYTCAAEFDFMEAQTPWRLLYTLLWPAALLAVVLLIYELAIIEFIIASYWDTAEPTAEEMRSLESEINGSYRYSGPDRCKPHAELVYHVLQLGAYTVMAVLIMRLKLFWTPYLALTVALLAKRDIMKYWIDSKWLHTALVLGLLAAMSVQGSRNLQTQWNIKNEYNNYPLEELITWIRTNTAPNDVFAASMALTPTIMMCAQRPIVNHPHYENAAIRNRTRLVYSFYSRKPEDEIVRRLNLFGVKYFVAEPAWCWGRTRPGCQMPEVWDIEDPDNSAKVPFCEIAMKQPARAQLVRMVYQNQHYGVFRVPKL